MAEQQLQAVVFKSPVKSGKVSLPVRSFGNVHVIAVGPGLTKDDEEHGIQVDVFLVAAGASGTDARLTQLGPSSLASFVGGGPSPGAFEQLKFEKEVRPPVAA